MDKPTNRRSNVALSLAMGMTSLLIVAGIVYSPGEAFSASLAGLQIWWQNVFPGLLPPLMLADLLAASGLLHGVAALAEPLTRGLFRLPGTSGWAIAFGWSAGIPAGAKEAARLKERGMLKDEDLDTVLLVSHLPNPFLVILVVGCGFLHSAPLGWSIALGLWLSVIVSGFIWARIAKPRSPKLPSMPVHEPRALLRRAVRAALDARQDDSRPFGKQLADSVTRTVATLMTIGGLMMMSAVVIRLLLTFIPGSDLWLAFPGLYEMHLGAYESSRSALFSAAPVSAAAMLAAALAWSGWSGLLQARASFGIKEKFPWARVVCGRLLHGAIALLFTYGIAQVLTSKPFADFLYALWPTRWPALDAWSSAAPWPSGWERLPDTIAVALFSFAIFLLLALTAALIRPRKPRRPK